MTARQVHAVLAAGVENPRLIARWQEEPQRLLQHGIEPGSIDLAALWKFAGLTVKVRHNGLREELPLTFRLMNVAGLEIEVFAAYASFRASEGGRYAATTAGRTRDLIDFLEHWLDRGRAEHSMLWDVIRHEEALARLTKLTTPTPPTWAESNGSAPSRHKLAGTSVPRVFGEIIQHDMRCDPRAVAVVLRESKPAMDRVPLGAHHFCYWRPETVREIRILELDEFGYYALSMIDGMRSVADLSCALGGSRRPTRGFLQLLGQLGNAGILGFETRSPAKTP